MKTMTLVDVDGKTTLYFKKRNKMQLDMRFTSNKAFVKKLDKGKFWYFMQGIANRLGAPELGFGRLRWELYFNPIWHIQQWWWLHKPIR